MSEAQSGYIAFRPRARLLKLIGEELISDEVVALTELVKNAHDADARNVRIVFRNVTAGDGTIEIIDDGCGMDREVLLKAWMEPAGSTKGSDAGRFTPSGRRVLGEKGVGRFAADKLGKCLELISLRAGTQGEVHAVFDWDRFDDDGEMLSDVKNRWEIRPASEVSRQGTILRITGLRQVWTERVFRRLSTRLARLRPPFKSAAAFSIHIESDEFPDYAGEQSNSFLDGAPYSLSAEFDGRETLKLAVGGKKQAPIRVGASLGELSCGPVKIRLHAFDLETEAIAKIGPRLEVRAWLREWSGVSVYRDGFRLWPYGEPHDDWLRLDQRRVNNPVVRLSNNQIVGFIDITRDGNPQLFDQTNREGLMHNQAFTDLRRLIELTFQIIEQERQRVRHPTEGQRKDRRPKRVSMPVADALESFTHLADKKTAAHMRRLAGEARESVTRLENERRQLLEGYNDLAAAGLIASGVGFVAAHSLERAFAEFGALRARIRNPDMAASASRLETELESLKLHLHTLEKVNTGGSHRRRTMDVTAEVREFGATFAALLDSRKTRFEVHAGEELLRVDMNPQSFHRILYLLMSNSLDWLGRADTPTITVSARREGDHALVLFGDNGAGISRGVADRIFDPMFSLKEGGRGMGLTIARGLVEQNGGSIEVVLDGRRKGALFRLLLPRKRSRATVQS